jgi:hypothetical protein
VVTGDFGASPQAIENVAKPLAAALGLDGGVPVKGSTDNADPFQNLRTDKRTYMLDKFAGIDASDAEKIRAALADSTQSVTGHEREPWARSAELLHALDKQFETLSPRA